MNYFQLMQRKKTTSEHHDHDHYHQKDKMGKFFDLNQYERDQERRSSSLNQIDRKDTINGLYRMTDRSRNEILMRDRIGTRPTTTWFIDSLEILQRTTLPLLIYHY